MTITNVVEFQFCCIISIWFCCAMVFFQPTGHTDSYSVLFFMTYFLMRPRCFSRVENYNNTAINLVLSGKCQQSTAEVE